MLKSKLYSFLIEKKGWIPLFFLLIISFAFIFASKITTIIIVAFFYAYAISPMVDFLTGKLRFPRWLASLIIMLIIVALIFLLFFIVLPVMFNEIAVVIKNLPETASTMVDWIYINAEKLGIDLQSNVDISKEMMLQKLSVIAPSAQSTSAFVGMLFERTFSLLSFVLSLIIFGVISFFISFHLPEIYEKIKALFPPVHKNSIMLWVSRFDTVLSGFIRGQLTVCFVLGSFYAVGLTIIGLENAGSIGAMIGIFCFLPYVGLATGFLIAALLALSKGGLIMLVKIVIVFAVIQTIDTIFVTPNIIGKKVGINPIFVIIALFAGAEIGGFLGICVAVPTFAILKLVIEDMTERYKSSEFYKGMPKGGS